MVPEILKSMHHHKVKFSSTALAKIIDSYIEEEYTFDELALLLNSIVSDDLFDNSVMSSDQVRLLIMLYQQLNNILQFALILFCTTTVVCDFY